MGDVTYGRAYPGPRGAQRHREIRGPAQSQPRSGSISLLEDLDPGFVRRLRRRLSGKRVRGRHLWRTVIYEGEDQLNGK